MTNTTRRLFRILAILGLATALAVGFGCKGEGEAQDKHMPAAGHPEEVADSTRLDAAEVDTFQESDVQPVDSAAPSTEDSVSPE